MIINISTIPEELKTPPILNHKHINIKSLSWDLNKTTDVMSLVHKMMKICLQDDGIGLAAPQIGIFKQLFIIRQMDDDNKPLDGFITYFNPEWVAISEDGKETDIEGCLSVPGQAYEVARWKTIDATWYELEADGSFIQRKERLTGYRARVFQHEFFHFRARSIVDDGKPIKKLTSENKPKLDLKSTASKSKAVNVKSSQGARPKYS